MPLRTTSTIEWVIDVSLVELIRYGISKRAEKKWHAVITKLFSLAKKCRIYIAVAVFATADVNQFRLSIFGVELKQCGKDFFGGKIPVTCKVPGWILT